MSDDLVSDNVVSEDAVNAAEPAASSGETPAGQPAEPNRAGPRLRPDPQFHWTMLALCVTIVALSLVLSVRDQTRVTLPLIGSPLPELCMTKRWTNVGCPGCGMTRCFISLGHGDLAAAWSYNPAGLWFYAIVLFQIPFRVVQLVRIRRGLPELRTGWLAHFALSLLAILMIGQWLLKMAGIPF
jgi:hypothetical protein